MASTTERAREVSLASHRAGWDALILAWWNNPDVPEWLMDEWDRKATAVIMALRDET